MSFDDNGKFITFCFFSCLVHVLAFIFLSGYHYRHLAIERPSSTGISIVSTTYHAFKPEGQRISTKSVMPSAPTVPVKSEVPSVVAPLPIVAIEKNKAVEDGAAGRRHQDDPSTLVPKTETSDSLVGSGKEVAAEQQSSKPAAKDMLDINMLQAPPAKPYVVQSPDFEDVDLLFGYDKQREKQGEGPDSVHEHNHASVESVEKQTPGNDITQALPLYDVNPKPAYPDVARSRGWQGRVLLEVSVGADGTVDKVALMESSGYRVLDKAARKIVYRWKFIPAHVGGVSVPSKVQVPIDFLLNAVRG